MSSTSLPSLPPHYRDLAYVAEGAFGRVYRATLADGTLAAIKVLASELAGQPEVIWRFFAEYRRLAALAHPAFPRAIEEGTSPDGLPFYAMSFAAGEPLQGPVPPERAASLLAAVARALAALHARGWVHGDLKADNVLVAGDAVTLLDLGSAAQTGSARPAVEGTLEYMAPELLRQAPVGPEADWYALGVLGYLLLSGHLPFEAGEAGPGGLVRAQLLQPPPALAPALALTPAGEAVALLLAKDPARRAADLPAVWAALGVEGQAGALALQPAPWLARPGFAEALEALARPTAGAVALEAEPGTGKSRTLDALRLEASLAGRPWLSAGGGQAPWGAARLVVRQALTAAGVAPGEAVGLWLVDELPATWLELEPRARKLSLFAAVTEAWTAASQQLGAPVIAIDDWEQVDAASKELFGALLALPAGASWFLTAGPGQAPPGASAITLAGWDGPAITQLVRARLGQPLPPALAQALTSLPPQPGLVNALLEHWHATGALRHEGASWQFEPQAGSGADPWTRLWEEKLAGLGSIALELVRLWAAAGVALPPRLAGRTLGLADAALQAALDELASGGLLLADLGGLKLTALPQAARLAGELADGPALLARLARELAGPHPDTLPLAGVLTAARVAARGHDDLLALTLAVAGARRALEQMALDAATRLFADVAGRPAGCLPPSEQLALALAQGEVARLTDRLDEAAAAFERALALAEGAPALASQALLGLAKCRQLRGRYEGALEASQRAESQALEAHDQGLAARAAVVGARVSLFMGAGHEAVLAACDRAIAFASASGSSAMRAAALNLHGVVLIQHDPTQREAGLAEIREALALCEALGDPAGATAALENLGNAYLALGELREAAEAFERYLSHCEAHGLVGEGLSAAMNLALARAELGDAVRALDEAEAAAARARALERTFIQSISLAVKGQAAWRAGLPDRATTALDEALALAQGIKNKLAEEYIRLYRLEAAIARGDAEQAAEEAALTRALVTQTGHREGQERLDGLEAELARLGGELELALARARPLLAAASLATRLYALMTSGEAQLALGQPALAREHFEAAAAIARGWRAPWHLGAAKLGLARATEATAERVALAREALSDGEQPYARAGAAALLAEHEAFSEPAREAIATLVEGLAPLDPSSRARVLAAHGLPDSATLLALGDRRAQQQHTLLSFADLAAWHEALLEAGTVDAVHQALLGGCAAAVKADRGYLLGYERGRLAAVLTQDLDYQAELEGGFSRSIAEEALFGGEPLYLLDARADERWAAAASVQALALCTVVALPYGTPDQILGVVYLDRAAIEPVVTPDDLRGCMLLAGVAAARVASLRREDELRERLALEEAIAEVACAMLRVDTLASRREAFVAAVLRLTGTERGFWLARAGEGWQALASLDAQGTPQPYQPKSLSQSVIARAVEAREGVCLLDADQEADWTPGQSVLALGLRMVWCLPLDPQGHQLLYVDSTRLDTGDPRRLLDRLSALLARLAGPLVEQGV